MTTEEVIEVYRNLSAAVIEQALQDLEVPEHAFEAAAWLLRNSRKTIWDDWMASTLRSSALRRRVLESVARTIKTGRGAQAFALPATPRVRGILQDLLRAHVGDERTAALLASVPEATRMETPSAPHTSENLAKWGRQGCRVRWSQREEHELG